MPDPFVSFCFTTYKRRDYLRKTLQSIQLQTFSDYEVIVSDNDPEQSGRMVIEGFNDSRFQYYANEDNLGMKKSFNRSLAKSKGEYIVMIADDDPVYPDMLETLLAMNKLHPGYGLYLGGCNWYCTTPNIASLYSLKVGMNSCLANSPVDTVTPYSSSEFLKNFFNFKIFPSYLWSTGMVKREILIRKGGVPDYNTPFLGDYAYLSIMASDSGCVVINTALGHQTIHEQNFGRAQNEQISIAAINFLEYVSERIMHVENWPLIEERMKNFVGLWVLSHLTFLKRYYALYDSPEKKHLVQYEKEIFNLPLMKKFRLKYFLKNHAPVVHEMLVKYKSRRRTDK